MAIWDDVATNLYRNMSIDISGYKPTPLFSRLYSRGVQSVKFYEKIPSIISKIGSRWGNSCMGQPIDVVNSYVQGIIHLFIKGIDSKSQKKTLTLLTNSDLASITLDHIIDSVQSKLEVRAYLHWYARYVPEIEEEMQQALESLRNVSIDYKEITKF